MTSQIVFVIVKTLRFAVGDVDNGISIARM
jgi:hypothetical protein